MLRNYWTLYKVVDEIKSLINSKLLEVFTQDKDTLLFNYFDGTIENYLCISTDTNLGSIFLKLNFSRARKNTTNLFPELEGQFLKNIELIENDRIIKFNFNDYILYSIFYGGSKNNVIICNNKNIITNSFKNKRELSGKEFIVEHTNILQLTDMPIDTSIIDAISKCSLLLGKYYAKEFCLRNNIKNVPINELSTEEFTTLVYNANLFKREIIDSNKYYILKELDKPLLSLIPLSNYSENIQIIDNSISKAIEKRLIESYKKNNVLPDFKRIYSSLKRNETRLEKNISNIYADNQSSSRIENYKLCAELLSSQPNVRLKLGEKVTLIAYDGSELEIKLNPKLNLIENAQYYFSKVKNAREAEIVRKKRLPKLENDLKYIKDKITQLELLYNENKYSDMEKILKELSGNKSVESNEQNSKYRTFDLGEGYMFYVGKDAANNDELTMKFAKANDIWMHARGSGGSHSVLRMTGKAEKPPKYILEKAAQIAAYYSQARNAKYVHVSWTFKKYVRKPKGANPGSVVISKEDVIMVEPKLPE